MYTNMKTMEYMEKEIINGQIDYAIKVLKSMFERIKGYDISTEEFNEIHYILYNVIKTL